MSGPAKELGSDGAEQRQRTELLRRLELHRQSLDQMLAPARGEGGFPRSHTMRLIIGEPLLMAALSALAVRVFGKKLAHAAPIVAATVKVVTVVLRETRNAKQQIRR